MKTHVVELSTLTSPEQGKTLFIYLTVGEEVVSAVLIREEGKVEKTAYYVSRALQGVEIRYSPMERYVLTFVHTTQKLRSYFQVYPIIVVIDQLLKQILLKPDALEECLNELWSYLNMTSTFNPEQP